MVKFCKSTKNILEFTYANNYILNDNGKII